MSEDRIQTEQASEDGKPGGQDKSHEVRAGWGMVFLKDSSIGARGAPIRGRLRRPLKARLPGHSHTSRAEI